MAAKVKCPACGAKNALDARRCRICTAVINADIPDASATSEDKPAPIPEPSFDAGQIERQISGGRGAFGGASGLGARLAAAGNAPTSAPSVDFQPEPQAPDEAWSTDNSWDTSPQGPSDDTFSSVPVPGGQAPAPSDAGAFEAFDPNALFDAPPPSGDDPSATAHPQDFEPFDPDALFRNS